MVEHRHRLPLCVCARKLTSPRATDNTAEASLHPRVIHLQTDTRTATHPLLQNANPRHYCCEAFQLLSGSLTRSIPRATSFRAKMLWNPQQVREALSQKIAMLAGAKLTVDRAPVARRIC